MTEAEYVVEAVRDWAAWKGVWAVVRVGNGSFSDVYVVPVRSWSIAELRTSLDRYVASRGVQLLGGQPYFVWHVAVRRTLTGAAGLRDAGVKLSLAQTMGLEAAICEVTWVQDTGEVVDFRVVGRVDGLDDPPPGGV